MSTEDPADQDAPAQDAPMTELPSAPATAAPDAGAGGERRRPKLDLSLALGGASKERKRGKSMFGLLVGTLNKAKNEDKERNASEAAKKRQLIEQRLQAKLRKETDSIRRTEEAKKDKTSANRKEEELQLKDSIHKLRRTRLPHLSNFLCTSDIIPSVDVDASTEAANLLSTPARAHPPPLYYLPAILTPAQEAFLTARKAAVRDAAEKEWESFAEERRAGVVEIDALRQKVADEDARKKAEAAAATPASATTAAAAGDDDAEMQSAGPDKPAGQEGAEVAPSEDAKGDGDAMEVDDERRRVREAVEAERRDSKADAMQADDEEEVEY